jgi:hypothetical protein
MGSRCLPGVRSRSLTEAIDTETPTPRRRQGRAMWQTVERFFHFQLRRDTSVIGSVFSGLNLSRTSIFPIREDTKVSRRWLWQQLRHIFTRFQYMAEQRLPSPR